MAPEEAPKERRGPLVADAPTPAAPMRKARTPKTVQKGVELAFRKRQNAKFKAAKAEVVGVFRRVLEAELGSEAALRGLFRAASDQLALLGLPLGGTEEWADRLYIEGKGGTLMFSEDELDLAEAAQARMEVMYNVDTWSTQLSSRLGAGALLLEAEAAEGHKRTSPAELVARAAKLLDADAKYHRELFAEPASRLVLQRIDALGLPHALGALGEQLLARCAELLALATRALGAMAAAAEQHTIPATRGAAAQRASASIEQLRGALPALRERGVAVPDDQCARLDQLAARLAPLLPVDEDYDDDEYF